MSLNIEDDARSENGSDPDVIKNTTNHGFVYVDIITNDDIRCGLLAIYSLVTVLGSIGNIMVLVILGRMRSKKTSASRMLIFNLAACDLFNCAVHQPLMLLRILTWFSVADHVTRMNPLLCKVDSFFTSWVSAGKFHLLLLISIERYLIICHPLKAKSKLTTRKTLTAVLIVWIMALCISWPAAFIFRETRDIVLNGSTVVICASTLHNVYNQKLYSGIFAALYFILPSLGMLFCYSNTYKTLLTTGPIPVDKEAARILKTRRILANLMLYIAILFVLSNAPFVIYNLLILALGPPEKDGIFIMIVFILFTTINSAVNPFIISLNPLKFRRKTKFLENLLNRASSFADVTKGKLAKSLSISLETPPINTAGMSKLDVKFFILNTSTSSFRYIDSTTSSVSARSINSAISGRSVHSAHTVHSARSYDSVRSVDRLK